MKIYTLGQFEIPLMGTFEKVISFMGPVFHKNILLGTIILSTSNRIPTRGQSQIGSHVYFMIIAMVILL